MTSEHDWTGALNLLFYSEEMDALDKKVLTFRQLVRSLSPIIELEVMADYDYILEIYDGAVVLGQRVINVEFPQATTSEEFSDMDTKMALAIDHLESVDRVLAICFRNNFIRFY